MAWAGPWTVDERWWDPEAAHRVARVQVVVRLPDDGSGGDSGDGGDTAALLLVGEAGRWSLEGTYG